MSNANPILDPIGYRCDGCGRLFRDPYADFSAIRAAGGRSCCPERKPIGLSDRIEKLGAERDAALVALFECMEEIDAYIQQEYPQDHPVHERYRQRDYAANPARMFLRDRPDALVKARAMLAEADLKRQAATLKGQNDE